MVEWDRLAAGDEGALAALIEETAPALRRYCAGIVLDYTEAEDALQETYLRFWRGRAALREADKLTPFLYRVAYHVCVDLLRALKALRPLDRALLLQRALEERTYAELAAQYGKSEAALRKRYERARKRAAALLTEEMEEI